MFIAEKDGIRLPLDLEPLESMFIVFQVGKPLIQVVECQQNNQVIFPLGISSEKRTVEFSNGQFVAWGNGNFQLKTSAGNSKEIQITTIPAAETITGPWQIRFPFGRGAPQRVEFPRLISWTDATETGIRYFSGVAVYHRKIEVEPEKLKKDTEIILDLGKLSKVAEVFLNGRNLGIRCFPPFRWNITHMVRRGTNYLTVEVANVMSNQLTGDAGLPERFKRTHTNITKGPNAWHTPWKDVPLVESGLIGPVKLIFGKKIDEQHLF